MVKKLAPKESAQHYHKLLKWLCREPGLSSNAKIIYSVLLNMLDKSVGYSHPRIKTIMIETGLTHRQVTYAIEELVEKKLIYNVRDIGKPSKYYFLNRDNIDKTPNTDVRGRGETPNTDVGGTPNTNVGGTPNTDVRGTLLYNIKENIKETVSPFVLSIFDHWKESAQAKGMRDVQGEALDPERIKTIENALLYNSEQKLKKAINGCLENEWYRNSGNYGIGYILRNNDNITKFVNMQNSPNNPDSDISKEARQALQNIFAKRQTSEAARNAYNLARKELNTNNLGTYQDEKKVYSVFGRYYLQEKSKQ